MALGDHPPTDPGKTRLGILGAFYAPLAYCRSKVLREWQGLGYYSRARNLHYAAKQIVALGHFPDTLAEIKQLKGVGDYTAAAIGSIAFGLPAAVVDGNVYRVLARHFGIDTPINTTEGKKTFAAMAQELLPPKEASAYNQAIMDFGAIQCTPQSPHCDSCPLMESCIAFRERRVAQLPVKLKTLKVTERHLIYIYIRCQGQTAIRRRGPGDIWQGLTRVSGCRVGSATDSKVIVSPCEACADSSGALCRLLSARNRRETGTPLRLYLDL